MDDLVERESTYYKKFTDVPFTGKTEGKEQGSLKNGKNEGPWMAYWDNGQLMAKGDYKDGLREGSWVDYNKDGSVSTDATGTYKDGVKISD